MKQKLILRKSASSVPRCLTSQNWRDMRMCVRRSQRHARTASRVLNKRCLRSTCRGVGRKRCSVIFVGDMWWRKMTEDIKIMSVRSSCRKIIRRSSKKNSRKIGTMLKENVFLRNANNNKFEMQNDEKKRKEGKKKKRNVWGKWKIKNVSLFLSNPSLPEPAHTQSQNLPDKGWTPFLQSQIQWKDSQNPLQLALNPQFLQNHPNLRAKLPQSNRQVSISTNKRQRRKNQKSQSNLPEETNLAIHTNLTSSEAAMTNSPLSSWCRSTMMILTLKKFKEFRKKSLEL